MPSPIKLGNPTKTSLLERALNVTLDKIVGPLIGDEEADQSLLANNLDMQRQEMERCKKDPIHWINSWVTTYDPRIEDPTKREMPFKLFPKQEELVLWLRERRRLKQDGVIEKARDSGVSYVCLTNALHCWLFEDGYKAGVGSYKEEKVDRLGDPDSLFEKLRMIMRRLPAWMKPKGFKEREHMLQCRLMNPANGSIIIGEIGDNIGRGGRNLEYYVDESAFLDHPDLAESSLSGNTNVRFDISTPNGIGNWYYRKRHSLPEQQVFTFTWGDDPRKDEAWKQKMIAEKGLVVFEREYNLNYAASLEGIAIPSAWVKSAVNFDLPEMGDLVIGFDVAAEGDNWNVLCPRRGPRVLPLVAWQGANTTQTSHRAIEEAEKLGAVQVFYDCIGPGTSIKGAWDTLAQSQDDTERLPFEAVPVAGNDRPNELLVWPDGRTSLQKFANARAELWWIVRERFRKTHEHVLWLTGDPKGAPHPPEEMISIPNDHSLISELSTPLVSYTNAGKVQIESKVQMRRRGIKSPDRADALCYAFYGKEAKRKFWWV